MTILFKLSFVIADQGCLCLCQKTSNVSESGIVDDLISEVLNLFIDNQLKFCLSLVEF